MIDVFLAMSRILEIFFCCGFYILLKEKILIFCIGGGRIRTDE